MKIYENVAFHTDFIDFGGGGPSTKIHENIKKYLENIFLKFEENTKIKMV